MSEGFKQSVHPLKCTLKGPVAPDVSASSMQGRSVIIIADAGSWPEGVPGEILAV